MLKTPDNLPEFSTIVKEIQFAPKHQTSTLKTDSLLSIKRDFISNMLELSTELIGGENELISVFLALFLEDEPVTQDDLMNVTNSSRTKVSQALTMMEELNVVQIVKKPGDRKKYYKGASSMEEYGKGKLGRVQGYYTQIQMMMRKKFLPDLEKIEALQEEEKQEKERLKKFFEDNIYYYNIFIRFSTAMHEAIRDELQEVVKSVK
jgi:DNA-binding transcriptional regulator GbsR (MarR family)